jgi:exonuclease-1
LVFDGARLPMKKRIEEGRKKARLESRNKAEDFLAKGESHQAMRKFMEAVEINSLMIYRLIQVLETMDVKFIVAPYEADAQLAYLFKSKKVDLIITEDSDLLVYGVTRVFFKMDPSGQGIEIDLANLY